MRNDGRTNDDLRPIKITRGFTQTPAGSVLWEQGKTVVLCTASIARDLPPWFRDDRPGGWITGLVQLRVRGLAKAKCVALWCTLAYNLMHFGAALAG